MCDGQGIAHPRRFGIASHLGLILDVPTIGCAKSRLIGTYSHQPIEPGEWTPLHDKGEIIGGVLCTKRNCRPLFISPGHKISLEDSIEMVMLCRTRYRQLYPLAKPISLRIRLELDIDLFRFTF